MRFKQFICERIYVDGDKIAFTHEASKITSTGDSISTFLNPVGVPYHSNLPILRGVTVHSLYLYVGHHSESINMLKSLKGKGPYKVDPTQLDRFLNQSATWLRRWLKAHDIATVMYPKSSSPFLYDFIESLRKLHPEIEFVQSFAKREVKSLDTEIDDFIDTEHPDYEHLGVKNQKLLKQNIKQNIQKNIDAGNGPVLDAKGIFKGHAKFVKNFMKLSDKNIELEQIMGKNILVVDDVLSSGSTFGDMIRQVESLEPKSVMGLTLFKRTISPKDKE